MQAQNRRSENPISIWASFFNGTAYINFKNLFKKQTLCVNEHVMHVIVEQMKQSSDRNLTTEVGSQKIQFAEVSSTGNMVMKKHSFIRRDNSISGEKTLVFSNFSEMQASFKRALEKLDQLATRTLETGWTDCTRIEPAADGCQIVALSGLGEGALALPTAAIDRFVAKLDGMALFHPKQSQVFDTQQADVNIVMQYDTTEQGVRVQGVHVSSCADICDLFFGQNEIIYSSVRSAIVRSMGMPQYYNRQMSEIERSTCVHPATAPVTKQTSRKRSHQQSDPMLSSAAKCAKAESLCSTQPRPESLLLLSEDDDEVFEEDDAAHAEEVHSDDGGPGPLVIAGQL